MAGHEQRSDATAKESASSRECEAIRDTILDLPFDVPTSLTTP
jgi:hypothetical protein